MRVAPSAADDPSLFDPFSAEIRDEPYSAYRRLRDDAPVYYQAHRDLWFLSRYDDVAQVLRDWGTFSSAQGEDIDDQGASIGAGNILEEDPPRHKYLRAIVQPHFNAASVRAKWTGVITDLLDGLVEQLRAERHVDLAQDLAWPLPIAVVSRLLGVPDADRAELRAGLIDSYQREPDQPQPSSDALAGVSRLHDYFATIIAQRRRNPQADLLTTIATASMNGAPIGDDAVALAHLLFIAAVDTTGCLITNALTLLADWPDQREVLIRDRSLIEGGIEEIVRFETSVQNAKRTTTRDVELHGRVIPAGSAIGLLFGAANRDERRFSEPDRFDVTRKRQRHLGFGEGIHHCIGAPFARLEATLAVDAVLARFPHYELRPGRSRLRNNVVRGFDGLPATVS